MRRRSSESQWQLGMLPSFARLALHDVNDFIYTEWNFLRISEIQGSI